MKLYILFCVLMFTLAALRHGRRAIENSHIAEDYYLHMFLAFINTFMAVMGCFLNRS